MKILVTSNGNIIANAFGFAFGAWEEADKLNGVVVHKWKIENEKGDILGYIIDENMNAINGSENPSCQTFTISSFPADYVAEKYLYVNNMFVRNPEWTAPAPTAEERITELEEQLISSDEAVVLLYEMQFTQDEINVAQDEAITGLYEILLGGM